MPGFFAVIRGVSNERPLVLGAFIASLGLGCLDAAAEGPWQGTYVGVVAGFNAIQSDKIVHQVAPPMDIPGTFRFNEGLVGAVGGFNGQNGPMILGVEGAFIVTPSARSLVSGEPGVASGAYMNQNWQAEVLLRAGIDAGSFMPFVAAGPALASFDTTTFVGSPPLENDNVARTHWGVAVGGGVEIKAADRARVRFEYRYSHFFDQLYEFATPGVYDQTIKFSSHAARAGLIVPF